MLAKESIRLIPPIIEVFRSNGVDIWLSSGTLLGVVRERRLLPWDNDIDLAAPGEQVINAWPRLHQDLQSAGFKAWYRFNSVSIEPRWPASPPVSVELNWDLKDGTLLYLGGAIGERHLPLWASLVEWILVAPVRLVLGAPDKMKEARPRWKQFFWPVLRLIRKVLFTPGFLAWFSCLPFHELARSPYLLAKDNILPLDQIETVCAGNLPVPGNSKSVLASIYGGGWIVPNPTFDKNLGPMNRSHRLRRQRNGECGAADNL